MTIVDPVTVCVAFLSYGSFGGYPSHSRWDNRYISQWKVFNEYGTNGLQGPKSVASQDYREVARSKVQLQEQRVNLRIGQYAEVSAN